MLVLQKKLFTTSISLQFAQAMKGWGSRNRGVPPAKGSIGRFAAGKAGSKVPAAGKAAAGGKAAGGKAPAAGKGAAGKAASAAAAHERLRVKCGRVVGKVVRWRGQEGWIRPERAVDHPFQLKNNGEIFIAKADVGAGQQLQAGARVDFLVYSIKEGGGRLGADFCRILPKEGAPGTAGRSGAIPGVSKLSHLAKVRGSVGTTSSKLMAAAAAKMKSVAKQGSKDSNQAKEAKGAKGSSKGSQAPRQVIMKAAPKAKGSKTSHGGVQGVQKSHLKFVKSTKKALEASDGKGGHDKGGHGKGGHGRGGGDKERTVVAPIPRLGTIRKWRGTYGWIEADKAVDHPEAARNHGLIFLHIKDFQGEAVKEGIRVTFSVYVDGSGLGAQYCKPTQPSGESGTGKVIVPKARPMTKALRSDGPKEPSLPPFWEKHFSEQHKMPYFWNSKTKGRFLQTVLRIEMDEAIQMKIEGTRLQKRRSTDLHGRRDNLCHDGFAFSIYLYYTRLSSFNRE
eukprot:s2224_g3.t1